MTVIFQSGRQAMSLTPMEGVTLYNLDPTMHLHLLIFHPQIGSCIVYDNGTKAKTIRPNILAKEMYRYKKQ